MCISGCYETGYTILTAKLGNIQPHRYLNGICTGCFFYKSRNLSDNNNNDTFSVTIGIRQSSFF